ncbi:MAG: bile acid:sodium symporter [Methanomicrobium sp.]|nr:bile acid:sodium symporter [Methanomicrobium sp.]
MLLTQILLSLIYIFIISSMFSIGFGLSLTNIVDSFKRPGVLTRSVLINLIVLPLVAVFIAVSLGLSDAVLLGFLLMACAPGASYSPRITEVANGDVGHSTGLMFLLCTLAVFSTPFTLMLILPDSHSLDPWPVIETLAVIQMFPLFIGMYLRSHRPGIAKKLSALAFWISNISALIVIVSSLAMIFFKESNGGFFSTIFGTNGIFAIIIMVIISAFFGYTFGGSKTEEKKSMLISSVNRNAGVAFLIVLGSFSMIPVVIIMLIIYIIIQSIVSGGLAGFWLWNDLKAGKKTILSENKK